MQSSRALACLDFLLKGRFMMKIDSRRMVYNFS